MSETKERALSAAKRLSHYHAVFTTPAGEAVLADMMRKHGVMSAHPVTPQEMAIKEGERAVVLRILQILKTSPQKLIERIEHAYKDDE